MSNDPVIQTSAKNSADWLLRQKKYPVPYSLFKWSVNRQIEWWRTNRNVRLEFNVLAQAIKDELKQSGILVMAESETPKRKPGTKSKGKSSRETASTFGIAPDEAEAMSALFGWLQEVLAKGEGCSEIVFSANFKND